MSSESSVHSGAAVTGDGGAVAAEGVAPAADGVVAPPPDTAIAAPLQAPARVDADDEARVQRALERRQQRANLAREASEAKARLERSIPIDELRSNPLAALERAGLGVEQLAHFALKGSPPEPTAEDRIAKLEKELADERAQKERDRVESQKAKDNATILEAQRNLVSGLRENEDNYPFLASHNDEELGPALFGVAKFLLGKKGRVPTLDEILAESERRGLERYKPISERYTKRIAPKLNVAEQKKAEEQSIGVDLSKLTIEERVDALKKGIIQI